MRVIACLNQKGGVGKTSTCHHLSGALAKQGFSVLLVDFDPQASLTQGFWGPLETEALVPETTAASILGGLFPTATEVIRSTGFNGIDLVAGSWASGDWNVSRPWERPEMAGRLADFLGDLTDAYDIVLIDCPPNLNQCAWCALFAASHLVIPLQAEDYGAQGIGPVKEFFNLANEQGAMVELMGLLVTMFDARQTLPKLYDGIIRQTYGAEVFTNRVPLLVAFKEAVYERQPIAFYRPKGSSAARALAADKAIDAVAAEMLTRLSPVETEATHGKA